MIISSSKKVVLPEKRNKFSGRYVYLMMLLLTLLPTRIEAQDDGVIWRSTYNEDGVYYLLGKTTNDEDVAMITHGDEPYVQYEFDIKDCIYPYGSPVKVIGIGEEAFMDDNISYIDLPQYLTFIGERAFSGSNLQSIDIPNSVTTIANEAFARCGDLRTVNIGDGVTSIGDDVFSGCEHLDDVTFGSSVTNIGNGAFNGCTAMVILSLPNSLTTIGDRAFSDCTNLLFITIPKSVTSIGSTIFQGCTDLASIDVEEGNAVFDSRDNCNAIIRTEDNTLIHSCINSTIPNTVETIGDFAFSSLGLTSITIPNSVTTIGEEAFNNCNLLASITIPNSVTSIGSGAFSGCRSLTSITIPNSVTSIGSGAFSTCTSLTSITIPNSVTSIGNSAFSICTSLTSITIPNSVTSIGNSAFYGCSSLTSITIPKSVTALGSGIFYGCKALASIVVEKGNTVYDSRNNCDAIIRTADNVLLYGCQNTIILNSVTCIGAEAFQECKNLTVVDIPSSVTRIEEYAFQGSGLTDITFNNPDIEICSRAFNDTPWYTNQPNGLIYIGNWAYKVKGAMPTTITIKDGTKGISGSAFIDDNTWDLTNSVLTKVIIPNTVEFIGSYAFNACLRLTDVTIPNSVKVIGSGAFEGCQRLINMTIPNSVISMGDNVFRYCQNLTKITIGDSVTSIGFMAFYGCKKLSNVTIGSAVKSIGECAFQECSRLTSITIPNSVISIGNSAFFQCTGLTSIDMGNAVDSIGLQAFYDCGKLSSINIPNTLKYIGERAFFGCNSLTSFTIPDSVTIINKQTFVSCENLSSVTIGNSMITIDDNAFTACPLTSIDIPSSVTSINYNAFAWCKLNNVNIPNSVTAIGEGAFRNNGNLVSVTIPQSVSSIGAEAFNYTNELTSVTVGMRTPIKIDANAFSNRANATLYVPEGCKSAYEVANYWKEFKNIEEYKPMINFADDNVKAICVAKWDTDGDGELSEDEAAVATDLSNVFKGNESISAFPELSYFTGLNSISDEAFSGCSNLASIILPRNLIKIGNRAFTGCQKLSTLSLPASVSEIGAAAFSHCKGIIAISVASENSVYDSRNNCNSIIETATNTLICGCKNSIIPESVTAIGNNAFEGCETLTAITIPENVTSIGESAFASCKQLKSVSIPIGVTIIEGSMFRYCEKLDSVNIPKGVEKIGTMAFDGCNSLTSITLPANLETIEPMAFNCPNLSSVTVGMSTPIALTDGDVFMNHENAILYVPDGCKTAYENASYWQDFKEIVEMPDPGSFIDFADANVKVLCIANWDEDGDYELSETEASHVTDLGDIFKGNKKIRLFKELVFFVGLNKIASDAFSDCSVLKSIKFPSTLATVEENAFRNCESLTNVDFNGSAPALGNDCFYGCSSLEAIVLPSTSSLGEGTFGFCTNLKSVTLLEVEDDFPANCQKYQHSFTNIPFGNILFTIPDGTDMAERFIHAGYANLSNLGGLPMVRNEFEAEAARIAAMANNIGSGDTNTLTAAIESARSIVNGTMDYTTIYQQITEIKNAAKSYLKTTELSEGVNVTAAYIVNPDMDTYDLNWSITSGSHQRGWVSHQAANGDCVINRYAESRSDDSENLGNGHIIQEITDLPIGTYLLEFDAIVANQSTSSAEATGVSMVAGNEKMAIATENGKPQHFALYFIQENAGQCQIGLTIENALANWVAIDNVRLYYIGDENKIIVTDVSKMSDALYIVPFYATAGKEVNIDVRLKNLDTATSYGFELVLPEGMSIITDSNNNFDDALTLSSRNNKHTATTSKLSDNVYKVGVTSLSSRSITGNDGNVLTIKVHVDEMMAAGTYAVIIQNPLLVSADGTKPSITETVSTVTIDDNLNDYVIGDVDGDNVVDLADAVLVINYYVGKPITIFNNYAADVDGDGVIDLADAVKIINYYVGKIPSLARQK